MEPITITPDMVGKQLRLVDSPSPPPPPEDPTPDISTAQPLFSFVNPSKAEELRYNSWANDVRANRQTGHPQFAFSDGQVIEVSMRTDPPRIINGALHCYINRGFKDPSGHCEWRPRTPELIKSTYLALGVTYVWRLVVRFADFTLERVNKYPTSHITFLQVAGPPGIKSPPALALQTYRRAWRVQSFADGLDNSIYFGEPDAVEHEWWVRYRPAFDETGLLQVWQDQQLVADISGPTHYRPPASKQGWAGQQRFGAYATPTAEPVSVQFESAYIWKVSD